MTSVLVANASEVEVVEGDWTAPDLDDLARLQPDEPGSKWSSAAAALREALKHYERRQIVPLLRRTRERLAALQTVGT